MTGQTRVSRRRLLQALGGAVLIGGCGRVAAPPRATGVAEFRGVSMGALYSLRLRADRSKPLVLAAARDAVAGALTAVDAAMSTFRDDSELSRFNAHASDKAFALSPDTFAVIALAQRVSRETAGAFDVTVAPAVDAWGFGPGRRERIVPDTEVGALKRAIGWQYLALDGANRTVAKLHGRVTADLSGIAKGYAVDRAAQALDALGIDDYVIEAGGEVRARGHNAAGDPWQIGIEQPDATPRRPRYVIPLANTSIATSGDYRHYFERGGRRYCHEIDPANGRPIANRLASVSIVANECAYADALGKLIVLGPERAYARAVALGLAAYFVVREPDGSLHDVMTPRFAALGGRNAAPGGSA